MTRNEMAFDVVIVGAGPAGSHAAYRLAQQGARVAVLDKMRFPRDKPCGGAVSRKAMDLLGLDFTSIAHARVTGAWLAYDDNAVYRDANGVAAVMTARSELDAHLLERAVAAGAEFYSDAAVTDVHASGDSVVAVSARGAFGARYLFAADGAASTVRARALGRNIVEYAPAVEALVYAPATVRTRFAERALLEIAGMPRGYGWIFPKRDHLNVGVFSIFGARGIKAHLASFLARHPALARHDHIAYLGHPIPVRNVAGEYERGRVWLLGDAAGLAEAVLGEGIYFALKSADLAARAFARAGGNPRAGDYTRLLASELLPQLHAAERLARLCYTHPRFVFERIARSRYASGLFLGMVTGDVGYRECLLKSIATMPAWLVAPRAPVTAAAAV